MSTNSPSHDINSRLSLHMSLELSSNSWKLGFADQVGRRPRVRSVASGDFAALTTEIRAAKRAFGLDDEAAVVSCYEAGRDAFWVHRRLIAMGIESHVVEPSSIEVNRKKRRAKTDRIDAQKIVNALLRFKAGDRFACRMIRIPDAESEDLRNLNREMRTVKTEKTAHVNRIRSLLAAQGITEVKFNRDFPAFLDQAQTADGRPLMATLKERLRREFDRLVLAVDQIRQLQMQQADLMRKAAAAKASNPADVQISRQAVVACRLNELVGIGPVTSWTLATEVFAWRDIKNRRQLGALAGLTPTPHDSGEEEKEQGISKSGRGEIRVLMIEIAWGWLKFQPQSDLAKWYRTNYGDGTRRRRKVGIVALARKLLVALGRYIRGGEIPQHAYLRKELKFNYLASLTSAA